MIVTGALLLLLGFMLLAAAVHLALDAYLTRAERQDEGREE